jgi:hypothetical protein
MLCWITLFFFGKETFLFLVLLIVLKRLDFGEYIISDAFHNAEHFYAGLNFFKNGFFSVFPNLGYLEELPPLIFIKLINLVSFNYVSVSLNTSRSLITLVLLACILIKILLRNKKIVGNNNFPIIALIFLFILPIDRISLLIATLYSLFVLDYESSLSWNKSKLLFTILYFFPFLILLLSPTYLTVILFAFVANLKSFLSRNKSNYTIYLIWFILLLLLSPKIIEIFSIFSEITKSFDQAFGIPLKLNNNFINKLFWFMCLIYSLFVIFVSINDSIKGRFFRLIQYGLLFILWGNVIHYGFGRIDAAYINGRLLNLLLVLLLIFSYSSKKIMSNFSNFKITKIFPGFTFLLFCICFNFDLPGHVNYQNLKLVNQQQKIISLNSSYQDTVMKINLYAKGRAVINYAEPAISEGIANVIPLFFTTPYVTIGEKNQQKIIDLLVKNKSAIIYLGHDFNTYDGLDTRTRAPIVFRYISENYSYDLFQGNIFAIPSDSANYLINGNLFFTNFNLQKSALYFNKHKKKDVFYREISNPCFGDNIDLFEFHNEKNIFYANLECGLNFIPEVFFIGKTLSYEKV